MRNATTGADINSIWWPWARRVVGATILVVLVTRLGADPFLAVARTTTSWSIGAALALTAATTACCAWRWRAIGSRLGLTISMTGAVTAYYRSQFLNSTLPGGVLGDVHRGVRQGRAGGGVGRGLRSVAWERGAGQVVQVGLTAAVLLVAPTPWRGPVTAVGQLVVLVLLGGWLLLAALGHTPGRVAAGTRAMAREARSTLLPRAVWPTVVLCSALATGGHVLVFVVAARTAGVEAPLSVVVPLALVVLVAAGIPVGVAGWGPREGAAASAFAFAGLPAAQGLTVAVTYGVLALVATLPGALVLLGQSGRRRAVPSHRERLCHG